MTPVAEYTPMMSCANNPVQVQQQRQFQQPPKQPKKGMFGQLIEEIRDGVSKNKELQENLKKFKEEKSKMDEADSLKDMKDRLSRVNQVKDAASPYIDKLGDKVKDTSKTFEKLVKDATESDVAKKGQEVSEGIAKSAAAAAAAAKAAAEKLSEQGEEMSKTQVGKAAKIVKKDLYEDLKEQQHAKPYEAPTELRRRSTDHVQKVKEYEANEDVQDVVMHKDSKWSQQWKDFRDNNTVVTGLFSMKTKFDESDNIAIRATRVFTDKLSDIFSDTFKQSEHGATLQEITKIDPSFNQYTFTNECQQTIIPTVLEAYIRGDIDVIQDWCHEGAYNILSTNIKQTQAAGWVNCSKIFDIDTVTLELAKMMEQGPVLIFSFSADYVECFKDKSGKIVEGADDKVKKMNYVWAMCRDQTIFDHQSAWRVLEFGVR